MASVLVPFAVADTLKTWLSVSILLEQVFGKSNAMNILASILLVLTHCKMCLSVLSFSAWARLLWFWVLAKFCWTIVKKFASNIPVILLNSYSDEWVHYSFPLPFINLYFMSYRRAYIKLFSNIWISLFQLSDDFLEDVQALINPLNPTSKTDNVLTWL